MIFKEHFLCVSMKKSLHFLNKSSTENPLPQELIRNKELFPKIHEFKEF